jgi:hypothetical protein
MRGRISTLWDVILLAWVILALRAQTSITAIMVLHTPLGCSATYSFNVVVLTPTTGREVLIMAPGLGKLEILPFVVASYNKKVFYNFFPQPHCADDMLPPD